MYPTLITTAYTEKREERERPATSTQPSLARSALAESISGWAFTDFLSLSTARCGCQRLDLTSPDSIRSRFSRISPDQVGIAVVTGANKGIGYEICRQLALNGVTVVLTARDDKRGIEALNKLKESCGFDDDDLFFHRVDVMDPESINSLADFVKTQFGKLDILVNNAGIGGTLVNREAFAAVDLGDKLEEIQVNWSKIMKETCELAVECLETNYYGPKRIIEALVPLLELSDSPRIVSVSSSMGKLKGISNEWAKGVLSDSENLTEERVEEVLNQFLRDFMEGQLKPKGWPTFLSAYTVSKAALNAYTRIAAKNKPNIIINCVCPGFVRTDMNFNRGVLSVEEGAASPVRLALLPHGSPSGLFFVRGEVSAFE